MEAINIPIEVPGSGMLNMEELKQKLTSYAHILVRSSLVKKQRNSLRSMGDLQPAVQDLCGVVSFPEEDLEGDEARNEYLKGV